MPNTLVDMDSWRVSACYPRRTFYPLSDGPSTQNHRITMTVFRLCSTCQSHSQASLCHCTLRTISDRSELTFARLRYYLGGDRPSQTTHHTMSCCRITANSFYLKYLPETWREQRTQTPWFNTLDPPRHQGETKRFTTEELLIEVKTTTPAMP